MMVRIFFFIFIFSNHFTSAQIALNMELFSSFNRGDTKYSGCWAYVDSSGNEYALIGARTGTAAYAIDEPITQESGFISGPHSNWREIMVIGHHAYVTTEGNTDSTGMQVIDLQYLPDSLYLLTTYDMTFTRGHILQKDVYSEAPYIYVNGTPETQGVHILDVSDPANPVEVGLYAPGYYIHDCFVKGDLLFAAAFYESTVDILDISDKTNPVLIAQIAHFDGNTHSSWVTEDNQYLMVTSELDGKPARIYNIVDLQNITEVATYTANSLSLVHNPYIRGDYAFISHNTEGIRVVDLKDPEVPVEVAYYDTWDGQSGGFHGLWSACPFYPSGKIIGANREDGLKVWTFNDARAGRIYAQVRDSISQLLLPFAMVTIPETNDTLFTDLNGQIKWGALPGSYTMLVEKEDYLPKIVTFELSAADSLVQEVLLSQENSTNVNATIENLPTINLHPNPSSGSVSLNLTAFEQSAFLQIYNIAGQLVFSQKTESQSAFVLELDFLNIGVYQIILMDKNKQAIANGSLIIIP